MEQLTACRAYVTILRETASNTPIRLAIQGALIDLRNLATAERQAAGLIDENDTRCPDRQTQDWAEATAHAPEA